MRIRTFCHDDISEICTLINSELGYSVTCKDLEIRIMQMQEDENYMIFTAVDNEKIIGFIGLQMCLAFESEGKIMRVIALAVARDFQKQGVGSSLIQKAEDYAKHNDASVIVLNSGLKRTQAHRFYEKQSFYKKGYSFCKRLN